MDENNIIKKKKNKNKNKNYYRRHNNQHNYYYKKKKKKNLILENTGEIENILLYNEQTKVHEEEVKPEIPVIKVEELIRPVNTNNEEMQVIPEDKQKDKKHFISRKIKIGMSFAIFVLAILGVSYSFFNYTKIDSRQADISSGDLYVKLVENSSTISLTKMYPRTDEEARERNDNYFDFTVKAKNTSNKKDIYYTISINNGQNVSGKTRIDPKYIRLDLQEKVNNAYVYIKEGINLNNYKFKEIVPSNTASEITKEYRLRIWVNDDILISDTAQNASYTQAEFANLYANFEISVDADDIPPAGGISSCPGCKFMFTDNVSMYTTWNSTNHTPNVIINGLYDDYEELVDTLNNHYFLGVKLNSNHEVTDAYSCGIKGDVPFCIKSSLENAPETAAIYVSNKSLLQSENIYNNTCVEGHNNPENYINCGEGESLYAYTDDKGRVSVGLGTGGCDVDYTGEFVCF